MSAELDPAVHRFNKIEWRVSDGTMIHPKSMIQQSRDWGRSSWLKSQPGSTLQSLPAHAWRASASLQSSVAQSAIAVAENACLPYSV